MHFSLSLHLQYRAGLFVLLRITPTLPRLQISPGRLCLGHICPGPPSSTMEQASSKTGQGLSLPRVSTELYKPSTNPASRPWLSEKVALQYLDAVFHSAWKDNNISSQLAKLSLKSPLLPQSMAAGQAHITQAQSHDSLMRVAFL